MAQAAKISLERRVAHGGGKGGFPAAWFAALWARLESGDNAYAHIANLLSRTSAVSLLNGGGKFQIDANLGATAAIAEMLLQSHADEIAILPALPAAWAEGGFNGLRARGNLEVDAQWSGGRLTLARLRPAAGAEQRLRPPRNQRITRITCRGREVGFKTENDGVCLIRLQPQEEYTIACQ